MAMIPYYGHNALLELVPDHGREGHGDCLCVAEPRDDQWQDGLAMRENPLSPAQPYTGKAVTMRRNKLSLPKARRQVLPEDITDPLTLPPGRMGRVVR